MAYTFKLHLTTTEPIIYAFDARGNWIEEFVGNPNQSMKEFHDIMLSDVRSWLKWRGYDASIIDDAVMEVHWLFSAIVRDASLSGTWMNMNQLYTLETWRVVNMANAVRG